MSVYRAVASLDVVPLEGGGVLLRADAASSRLEGESAVLLADKVLPCLREWSSLDDLSQTLPGYAPSDLEVLLDSLVSARLLVSRSSVPPPAPPGARLLADLGIDEGLALERLKTARVAVIGAGAAARHVRDALRALGLARLRIVTGGVRSTDGSSDDPARSDLSRETVAGLAGDLDLMIVAVDRAFLAARHWANRAALETGCAAIFLDVTAIEAVVGPTVLPGETGCYTCFRMRHLATSDAFAEAMAHEHYLDARRDPDAERPAFPGLALTAAGMAVGEAVRLLFGPLVPALANAVLRVDPLLARTERHEILRQPDCPHCRGIDTAVRMAS